VHSPFSERINVEQLTTLFLIKQNANMALRTTHHELELEKAIKDRLTHIAELMLSRAKKQREMLTDQREARRSLLFDP
jgi:hypothetical protein